MRVFDIIIMDKLSERIFNIASPIVPRVGDALPVLRRPYPIVKAVCLNVECSESILNSTLAEVFKDSYEKLRPYLVGSSAIVTVE